MPWWWILILIVGACCGLAVLSMLPFAYAMGAAFGEASKGLGLQEPADQPSRQTHTD